VTRGGGNTCAPLPERLDLKAPAVGYGPHRTIHLAGQTGIDAKWQGREGFRAQAREAWGSETPPVHVSARVDAAFEVLD
jgi:hypothetical protein